MLWLDGKCMFVDMTHGNAKHSNKAVFNYWDCITYMGVIYIFMDIE